MNKKPGLIQIDADGLWVIFQHFGFERTAPEDLLYASALPGFLDLFGAYGIKATFFVVGHDLLTASKVKLLKKAVTKDHEIANHTMNHAEGFSFLPVHKKEKEIEDAEKIIQDTLGVTPKGFRSPCNAVDSQTLKILEERGYAYDSSLLPTYYGPLLRKLKLSSLNISRKDHYLGKSIPDSLGFNAIAFLNSSSARMNLPSFLYVRPNSIYPRASLETSLSAAILGQTVINTRPNNTIMRLYRLQNITIYISFSLEQSVNKWNCG